MKKVTQLLSAALLSLSASAALAADPTSLAEVGTQVVTDITANKGMLFTVMGAVMMIAVLLMIFYKGKRVAK
jgi:hypothetical protein